MATSTLGSGTLVLAGTTSGTTTVTATAVAGTTTLTLPAATDTLVGKATTDTLTNKTLTSPVLTTPTLGVATATSLQGIIGNVTPADGSFTTLSASSTLSVTGAGSIQGLTVGRGAGAVSTNTAVGASALAGSNSGTGVNTAVGNSALLTNSTGYYNTAIGAKHPANYFSALESNTTGNSNIAVGTAALGSNTTGSSNTAVGFAALPLNTTASNNTAVGYRAAYSNTTGTLNTVIGVDAGYDTTTGSYNTFLGYNAGGQVTTGSKNTIIGRYPGNQGGLDIRTASNYIVLSDGDGNPRGVFAGANFRVGTVSALINESTLSADSTGNTVALKATTSGDGSGIQPLLLWNSGTSGNNVFQSFFTETSYTLRGSITYNRAGGLTAYNTTSDYRAKDILGPVTGSGALIDSVPVYMGKMKGATQERPMFIAHETPLYAHTGEKDAVDVDGNPVYQQMDASALIPVMWAEIQSLRKRLAALESK